MVIQLFEIKKDVQPVSKQGVVQPSAVPGPVVRRAYCSILCMIGV